MVATIVLCVLAIGGAYWIFKLFNDGTIGNIGRLLGVLMILLGVGGYFVWYWVDILSRSIS